MITDIQRSRVADRPVVAVTLRGKELQVNDSVAIARALLSRATVKVVPVLDGRRYVGSVDRDTLVDAPDGAKVEAFAAVDVPVVPADVSVEEALGHLDTGGGQRLVVLAPDRRSYVGIVCLRGDRRRLCVDTERLELTADGLESSAATAA